MGRKRKITKLDVLLKEHKKRVKAESQVKKYPTLKCTGKRTTKMLYEVVPWARGAKYNELAAVTE